MSRNSSPAFAPDSFTPPKYFFIFILFRRQYSSQAATCVGMEELCLNWSALDTLVHIAATFSVFANSMRFAMIFSSGDNFTFRCFIMDVIFF